MGVVSGNGMKKLKSTIFSREVDAKKAILLTFIAFLFVGFQCAIYGMLTVPISKHFGINSNIIIFFDGFGLWGQILAMAIGGFIIRRIKGKNTLVLAAILMIGGSLVAIISPNIYIYTSMTFVANMAIGFSIVACNYMIMGTVRKEGESEGKLSILNVFFSLGFLLSTSIVGFIIFKSTWQWVFILIMVLFVIFIIFLLSLRIDEILETAFEKKSNVKKVKFLTPAVALTAVALFFIVYAEQIMNYYNQPHLHYTLHFNMAVVGIMVSAYTFAQLIGRFVFGKYLLPKVQIHKYVITSAILFGVVMLIFLTVHSLIMVFIIMAILGLCDSCIYPSVLGYGMDQLSNVSSSATSFLVTIGAIGIPVGTSLSGIIGASFGRDTAMLLGPLFLFILAGLIFIVHKMRVNSTNLA